jgi:SAM-dependent methyltransferase
MSAEPALASLIDAASAPYRAAGRFAWHFARGKLRGDPVFAALLAQGLLAGRARVLDLGCGQGLLAAWLLAARALEAAKACSSGSRSIRARSSARSWRSAPGRRSCWETSVT